MDIHITHTVYVAYMCVQAFLQRMIHGRDAAVGVCLAKLFVHVTCRLHAPTQAPILYNKFHTIWG